MLEVPKDALFRMQDLEISARSKICIVPMESYPPADACAKSVTSIIVRAPKFIDRIIDIQPVEHKHECSPGK